MPWLSLSVMSAAIATQRPRCVNSLEAIKW